jgi:IclR family acetate operon transcriptional repressor
LTLDEIPGQYLMGVAQDIGSRWPLHATSTGKAILAYLPSAQLEVILQAPLAAFTPKTITDPEVLRQELKAIREQGFAVAAEELEIGFVALGAPVCNHHGQIAAAISVGGPTARLAGDKLSEIAALVKATARRISLKLGFRAASEV